MVWLLGMFGENMPPHLWYLRQQRHQLFIIISWQIYRIMILGLYLALAHG